MIYFCLDFKDYFCVPKKPDYIDRASTLLSNDDSQGRDYSKH